MAFSDVVELDMDVSVANSGLLNKHLSSVAPNNVAPSRNQMLPHPSVKSDASDASSSRASSSKSTDFLGGAPSQVMMSFKVSSEVKKYMTSSQEQIVLG